MARLTPEDTSGLPANRYRSRTPTSTAKIAADAAAMTAGSSGLEPAEPWVSEITAYFYSSKGEFATSVARYQKGAQQALSIGHLSRWLECSTIR